MQQLVDRVRARMAGGERVLLGIAGAPGAGKSTLAEALVRAIDPSGATAAWIPMDGFHLADVELDRLGLRERKGAIETFDGWGYLALLRRLRAELDHAVYGPGFERTLEQPIAGAMPVPPSARLVVTEGNYLLDAAAPWTGVRAALDEVWFVEVDDALRRERLVARHVRFGKSPEEARAWVAEVDERNAERVALGRERADLVVSGGVSP
jgi:pantothenate kinase